MSIERSWCHGCLVSLMMLGLGVSVEAQDATTEASIDVRLEVYRAADLAVTPIDFGLVLINGESGSVTMDSIGGLTFDGGILEVYDGPGGRPARAGTLTIDANEGAIANITIDPLVDMGAGIVYVPTIDNTTVVMNGGPETVNIYGALTFPANTQTGTYEGLLTVNVAYN